MLHINGQTKKILETWIPIGYNNNVVGIIRLENGIFNFYELCIYIFYL